MYHYVTPNECKLGIMMTMTWMSIFIPSPFTNWLQNCICDRPDICIFSSCNPDKVIS